MLASAADDLFSRRLIKGAVSASEGESYVFTVGHDEANQRLDHFLLLKLPGHSRSYLNRLILSAAVSVDSKPVKAGYRLRMNESVSIVFPPSRPSELVAEQLDFPILYEDEHLLVIIKPPGLVVHPAAGHQQATLVNGLIYHCQHLPESGDERRPGIVHRLDKDTSGVMLVAKSDAALRALGADFKDRKIRKTYHALLIRTPRETAGRIVAPIGRHPVHRKKMAVCPHQGKYAATSWQLSERFANGWCLAEISIETGRTHQIRVHMAYNQTPVAGDALYGGSVPPQSPWQPARQMLHASTLYFTHPITREEYSFTAPLWSDMHELLTLLREVSKS